MKVQRKGEERRGLEESTDCPKVGGYKNLKRCKEGEKKQCIAEKKGDRRDERLEEKAKRKGNRRGEETRRRIL